jgi:hypothetical protein
LVKVNKNWPFKGVKRDGGRGHRSDTAHTYYTGIEVKIVYNMGCPLAIIAKKLHEISKPI